MMMINASMSCQVTKIILHSIANSNQSQKSTGKILTQVPNKKTDAKEKKIENLHFAFSHAIINILWIECCSFEQEIGIKQTIRPLK